MNKKIFYAYDLSLSSKDCCIFTYQKTKFVSIGTIQYSYFMRDSLLVLRQRKKSGTICSGICGFEKTGHFMSRKGDSPPPKQPKSWPLLPLPPLVISPSSKLSNTSAGNIYPTKIEKQISQCYGGLGFFQFSQSL